MPAPPRTRRAVLALGAAALAVPFVSRSANASGTARPVVELFTSQGCSSCPPADAVLGELIEEGVIALAHHVTYWDYLGWADPLASVAGTKRQYGYAASFGRRGVYTPQAVVNGRSHHVGSRGAEVRRALVANAPALPVAIERVGNALSIAIEGGTGMGDVVLMRFADRAVHDIERGENRGRTLTYRHPVHAIERLGAWNGEAARFTTSGGDGIAVLVQERGLGPIIGAATLSATA